MRWWVAASVMLVAAAARADDAGPETDAWTDFTQKETALENTTTADCATACKALESLARAAEHICSVAPEHCEEAKARLRAASDRVHAACPQCITRGAEPTTAQENKQPGAGTVAAESAPPGGGCAGCSTTSPAPDGLAAFAALAALGLLRKKRTRDV
jgi:MYXO-CTERM domain-containing protein